MVILMHSVAHLYEYDGATVAVPSGTTTLALIRAMT
jgi:hypothetical protein